MSVSGVFFLSCFPPCILEHGSLTKPRALGFWLDWLASKPWGSSCPCLSVLTLQVEQPFLKMEKNHGLMFYTITLAWTGVFLATL